MGDLFEELVPGPLDEYRKQATFDWRDMKLFFEHPDLLRLKMRVWNTLEKDPVFQRSSVALSTDEMKRRTALRLHRYCQYNFITREMADLPYSRKTRYLMTINEALAATFPDVSVKLAIGGGLFKNALTTLGTERHLPLLHAAWSGKVLSCLAITEIAHGSNTKQMRTTATYDPRTQEFVINTPDFQAAKCWVGNLGKTCTVGLLFAQLYTRGECQGLHGFIVPIRDPRTLLPYPGIVVGDMGEKIGLHGIDNGFMMFTDYRIPKDNLLNRTGDVTAEGDFESRFSEPGKILGAALEILSTGRVGIMQESVNNLISAVTIAGRYAGVRKQFSANSDHSKEAPILEYQLHQWRILPYLAAAAVLKIFVFSFTEEYLMTVERSTSATNIDDLTEVVAEIHALVSSAKPLVTWTCRDAVQECREACGGHGFLKAAQFGNLRGAIDACVTYEGDNNVLGQQTSNWLLRQWEKVTSPEGGADSPMGTCNFLRHHQDILRRTFSPGITPNAEFIKACYEWLITYLLVETRNRRRDLLQRGKCTTEARNESQVYRAAVLSRAYAEFNALLHFWRKLDTAEASLRPVLDKLGLLYGFSCLEKNVGHFYEGGYATGRGFGQMLKDGVLEVCASLKGEVLGVIDALAPPDYVLNSVLGKSDGKLYENLQTAIIHAPGAMSRPDWWHEIIVPDAPDFYQKSKL